MEELGVTQPPADDVETAKPKPVAKAARLVLGIAVTVLCFVYIFQVADISEIGAALAGFDWRFGFLAIASLAVGYALRIYRWAMMLRISAPGVTTKACAAPYLASIALNNLLPFRTGDAIRAFVFPKALGITRSQSVATLVFERLLDLIILAAILGLGVNAIGADKAPSWLMTALAAALGLGVFVALLAIFGNRITAKLIQAAEHAGWVERTPLLHRLLEFADSVFSYIAELTRGSRLGAVVLLGGAIWCFEAGVFAAVMAGLGDPVSLTAVALIAGLATIATLAPSSPGYFGPFHLAAFESYQILFGEPGRAAAMAVLSHAAIWAPTTVAGVIALIIGWRRFGFSKLSPVQ